jgi:hypothetical protein
VNYLIVYDTIPYDSFIKESFDCSRFSDLVIGKKKYIDILIKKIGIFKEYTYIFTPTPLFTFSELYKFFHENITEKSGFGDKDSIIYFDISNYSIDYATLNNILNKIKFSDSIIIFKKLGHEGVDELVELYHIPIKILLENQELSSYIIHHAATISINVTNIFINLKNPHDVIELFASNFQIRHFNQLKAGDNYFIKSSANKEKIRAEYLFLSNIPHAVKPYYPHVGEIKEENSQSSYEIEKIYYFDVSKLFVGNIFSDPAVIHKFLSALSRYLNLCPKKTTSRAEYQNKLREIFIDKTINRIKEFTDIPILGKLDLICSVNGYESAVSLGNLIIEAMRNVIEKIQDTDLVFSHGDLCFSNILYNKSLNNIKLVDPKGVLNSIDESYIPMYYDLAKLSHSFLGLYDLILYDYVETVFSEEAKIILKYYYDQKVIETMSQQFNEFLHTLGYTYSYIRLFESSLFISMIPLHKDSNQRMIVQLLQAMNSYDEHKKHEKK